MTLAEDPGPCNNAKGDLKFATLADLSILPSFLSWLCNFAFAELL